MINNTTSISEHRLHHIFELTILGIAPEHRLSIADTDTSYSALNLTSGSLSV